MSVTNYPDGVSDADFLGDCRPRKCGECRFFGRNGRGWACYAAPMLDDDPSCEPAMPTDAACDVFEEAQCAL